MTPTTNGISFANISHHRSELMGLAMIAIVLFHVNVPRLSPFYGLWRM
jgi:acyltransferase